MPLGPSWLDDPQYLINHIIPKYPNLNIGSPERPINNIYVGGTVVSSGGETIVGNFSVVGDTSLTGAFGVTGVSTLVGAVNVTGAVAASSTVQGSAFNLADGSDKNHNVSTFASGTAYVLTTTSAALDFGTSDPTLVLDKAGTYLILARANLKYNGATFAATRAVTLKLRRTNNTPADLTGGSKTLATAVTTTVTATFDDALLPPIFYTTTNTNDIITIFGDVAVGPTAGSLDATEANIIAIRIS